jgi:lactoylglutathione lyase
MYAPPPHLNLVVLRSPDIERAATFYQMLGLLFTKHSHGSGPVHYTSEVSGLIFELYPMTPKSLPTVGTRIGFRIDSVEQVVPMLVEVGAEVLTPAHDSEWGRRAVVKDLDGHIVELVTPKAS